MTAAFETTRRCFDDYVCEEEREEGYRERIECFPRYRVLRIDGE